MDHRTLPQYWVNHLGFLLRKTLVQDFKRHGHTVTAEEWAVLLILQGQAGISTTTLSDQTLRDKTTTTRLVDKLVAKGLVRRDPDKVDRRVVRLSLTESGCFKFGQLAEIAQRMIAKSLQGIGQSDQDIAVSVMTRMVENLKSNPESEAEDGL